MSRLEDMAVFVAIVRDGSFTAAARSLGVAKQSVSERLTRLEAELGVQLLVRSTRALRLTDAGTRYHEASVAIVERTEAADREAREAHKRAAGTVRITAPFGLGVGLLLPAASELMQSHPDVRLELVLDERVVDLVREGIDLAVRAGSVSSTPTFIARPLFETPTGIVASPALIARYGRPVRPGELTRMPCAARRASDTWTIAGERTAISPRLVVNAFEAARDAALASAAVAQVPIPIVLDDLRTGRLELLFAPTSVIPFTVLWPARRLPLRVRLLLDALARHARTLTAAVGAVVDAHHAG